MKQATHPYFHFDGNCREAMNFYQNLFGGELEIMSVGESPMKEQLPEKVHPEILHACLTNGNFNIMASDMCGMGECTRGNNVQINLDCTSEEEIKRLYEGLSEKGTVHQELGDTFWGALFAMVTDPYGVRWMLNMKK